MEQWLELEKAYKEVKSGCREGKLSVVLETGIGKSQNLRGGRRWLLVGKRKMEAGTCGSNKGTEENGNQ